MYVLTVYVAYVAVHTYDGWYRITEHVLLCYREGHFEATSLLLEHEAQINVPSGSNDDTPLTLACWKGHTKVVQLLISKKSNIDHQTKTGEMMWQRLTRS